MKPLLQKIQNHPYFLLTAYWSKLLSLTGMAQIAIQAMGFVSGIIVIRTLPTEEYALYTLANTMLGTLSILADGGLSSGIMAEGGKVWQNPQQLGGVLYTANRLRKRVAAISLLFATPVLFGLMHKHQPGSWSSILILCALIPAFLATFYAAIPETVLKLRQKVIVLQKIQVGTSMLRLSLVWALTSFYPLAFLAVLAAGIPQAAANKRLNQAASAYIVPSRHADAMVETRLKNMMSRILPTAVYYCLSGQITLWMLSVAGTTQSLAQFGALGRLVMLLNIIQVVFTTLITPRFARMQADGRILRKRYLQIQGAIVLVCTAFVLSSLLFPGEVLWVLGRQYANLEQELTLSVLGSCLALMAAVSYTLYTCRGWVIAPAISIAINLLTLLIAALTLNVSTLTGILQLNIVVALVQVIMNFLFSFWMMSRSGKQSI